MSWQRAPKRLAHFKSKYLDCTTVKLTVLQSIITIRVRYIVAHFGVCGIRYAYNGKHIFQLRTQGGGGGRGQFVNEYVTINCEFV